MFIIFFIHLKKKDEIVLSPESRKQKKNVLLFYLNTF